MTIITSKIMKYNRYFISESKIQITILMSTTSIFTSNMAMICYSNVFISIFRVTNMACMSFFKVFFIFFCRFLRFVKFGFYDIFTIFNLFKHFFHKFVYSIFTSINMNWFAVFIIITTYDFITITTVCMLSISSSI